MRNIAGCCLLLLSVTVAGASQTPSPRPTPPDDVVRISTNLIQIDVSATDKNGKPVTDLRQDEIEIYENGKKQKITNFSFVSVGSAITKKPEAQTPGVPPPPAALREDQVRRTIALVVDDLSLSFQSAYYTRRALKKFVDEQMQDGDLVAIIRTGAGIGALQQFTSDKRILYAAVEKVRWNMNGTGAISAFAPVDVTNESLLATQANPTDTQAAAMVGESIEEFRASVFATGTLGALRYIVSGMGDLPGRKSVILFSDGFSLTETDTNGMIGSGRVFDYVRRLVDTANRAAVTFYSIDPRGLVYTGPTAIDNISEAASVNLIMSGRARAMSETQDGLKFLATATGGFAVINNNDIVGGVRRVMEDQSYYLIGYDPDSDTFDPIRRRFNKLEVKVLRKGVNVRYRSGFFNVADREGPPPTTVAGKTPVEQLHRALVSPFAINGVTLRLNALFGSDENNRPFVRSLLHIDAADLTFDDGPDGSKKASFDVLAMSFGDNGQPVDLLGKSYTLTVKPEQLKRLSEEGFVYQFVFPVKRPGPYQYRVAIRDSSGTKVGSASQFIDVPDLKKKRLTASSILLETLTADEWKARSDPNAAVVPSSAATDTAIRRVRVGSVLRYGYEIYNAKLDKAKLPKLSTRVRVFRDGKLVLDGEPKPYDVAGQTDLQHLKFVGALAIGAQMEPGDYVLQIIVIDELTGSKPKTATQFVQFEVVQ
jgi:VWFA-related protein